MSISSDEQCEHSSYNSSSFKNTNGSPIYPMAGQPFVYYAQVQHSGPGVQNITKRNVSKRRTNFFVKAFQWYTQDLEPRPKNYSRSGKTDVSGFAAWLDTKYEEFLHESTVDTYVRGFKIKQTSTITAEKFTNENIFYEPSSSLKKQSRLRSPWRKRRRATNKEASELREPSCKSCEFIMHPKNVTSPGSECCVMNKMARKDSKTSADSKISELTVVKSQGQVLSQGDNVTKCETTVLNRGTTEPALNTKETSNASSPYLTVECQCPEVPVVKKDANTQYDILNGTAAPVQPQRVSVENTVPKEMSVDQDVERIVKNFYTTCHCTDKILKCDKATQYECDTGSAPCWTSDNICYDYKITNESRNLQPDGLTIATPSTSSYLKIRRHTEKIQKEVCFANDAMQTSDHSIRLDYEYPLFMKIICADKLNENDN